MSGLAEAKPPVPVIDAPPAAQALTPRPTLDAARRRPDFFRARQAEDIALARDLGFSYVVIGDAALAAEAARHDLAAILEVDLDRPGDAILAEHPDWLVHGAQGPALRFLSDTDATVDWWQGELERHAGTGVAGFYAGRAQCVPAAVWARLTASLPQQVFVAEIFGATPAEAAALRGAGFAFCAGSSCFWDFSAAWLAEDSARAQAVADVLALAAPPGAAGWSLAATRRALRFSAAFAPGWLVDAGFIEGLELGEELRALLTLRRTLDSPAAEPVSSPGAPIALLRRGELAIAINASDERSAAAPAAALLPALGAGRLRAQGATAETLPGGELTLAPAELRFFDIAPAKPVTMRGLPKPDCDAPRIAIEAITPQVENGQFPVRRTVGELVTIAADILADGHDELAAELLVRAADEKKPTAYPMRLVANDRWEAEIPLTRLGRHSFVVTAWKDAYGNFVDELTKKHRAGVIVALELQEGLALVEEAARGDKKLATVAKRLRDLDPDELRETLVGEKMVAVMRHAAPRKFLVRSHEVLLDAERLGASFASWYEIFPRSQSGDPNRHGTLRDVIGQLPRIAAMGFDVLYFPPIHPIGRKNRKGKNNALTAGPNDPGSPYAIGAEEGGHDALHPELGTLADFRALVAAAAGHGIELALDFAIQCAPDHPWLREHKGWFDWRPDGSIRYAENPPKKYEDIVNVDFYTDDAKPALWIALRNAVQFWVDQGVKLFRVDNPHTKPLPFWEWLIADIRARHPDTVFLAEAFTRPKIMYRLAKIGFSQSYTYFTWRNTKQELTEYLTELSMTAPRDFFRPHFFVNTPDINPVFLQTSGRGGFLIRAALAATLSGLWGVYNGFELCDAEPVPGKEEYLNSEKYEIRAWDYDRPGNINAEITQLNRIRKANAALHSHLNVEFLPCDNPNVLYFRKFAEDGNMLLIAISLDPHAIQDTTIELPLWRLDLPEDGQLAAEDLMRGVNFIWRGKYQPVRLSPYEHPFCIWRIAPVSP
jgi:starch synthase (maltosyl-transferring)